MTIYFEPLAGERIDRAVDQAIEMKIRYPDEDVVLRFNGVEIPTNLKKAMLGVYQQGLTARYHRRHCKGGAE